MAANGINHVQDAVVALLDTVSLLRRNYAYQPKMADDTPYPISVTHIDAFNEKRRGWTTATTAGAGKKWTTYTVGVDLHSFSPDPADATLGEQAFNDLIDAVRAVLRANQTLAQATGILRFGEDIDVRVAKPVAAGDVFHYQATLTSQCVEEIDG